VCRLLYACGQFLIISYLESLRCELIKIITCLLKLKKRKHTTHHTHARTAHSTHHAHVQHTPRIRTHACTQHPHDARTRTSTHTYRLHTHTTHAHTGHACNHTTHTRMQEKNEGKRGYSIQIFIFRSWSCCLSQTHLLISKGESSSMVEPQIGGVAAPELVW
jgi:hypothetical protein